MIPTMQSGAELLREWIDKRGYKQGEAAERLGVAETFVSMLVNGKRVPSLENAIRIEELTGIPARAWLSSQLHETAVSVSAGDRKSNSHNE